MGMMKAVKQRLLPSGYAYRKVKMGLCKGKYMPLNLQYQFRTYLGLYELEIRSHVLEYARNSECVYDVGANTGYYSLAFDRLGVRRILAFEPESESLNLKKTFDMNKIRAEVLVFNYYVGNIVEPQNNKVSLDYVVFDLKQQAPSLIKMDIEGGEYEALQGAKRLLKEYSPKIIIEVHSKSLRESCKLLLENEGYVVRAMDQSGIIPKRHAEYNGWLCAQKIPDSHNPTICRS